MYRCALVLTAAVIVCASVHTPVNAEREPDLKWHTPELTGLRFELQSDYTPNNREHAFLQQDYFILRSYLSKTGQWHMQQNWNYSHGAMALRIASLVSGNSSRKLHSWTHTFDLTRYYKAVEHSTDEVSVTYKYAELIEDADIAIINISAEGRNTNAEGKVRNGPLKFELVARFDLARGLLASVKGTVTYSNNMSRETTTEFEYTLTKLKVFEDRAAMNKEINKVIERGLKDLDAEREEWDRRADFAAFVAYTYLQSGRGIKDDLTQVALTKMLPKPPLGISQIYHAGSLAMAIEAKYITDEERRQVASGETPSAFQRNLSLADRELMEEVMQYLTVSEADNTEGVFSYGKGIGTGQRPDLSNTQFAALAIAAASRCGVEIPVGLVRKMGEQLHQFQLTGGPKVNRVIDRSSRGKWKRVRKAWPANGYSYSAVPENAAYAARATGSMTAAGTCTALLLLDVYQAFSKERQDTELEGVSERKWLEVVEELAETGFAWLDHNYTVVGNPTIVVGPAAAAYYYLYSLERVGAFAPTEYISEHEWYPEGALMLMLDEREKGGWGKFENTCFALLFLSRATTPTRRVWTGK